MCFITICKAPFGILKSRKNRETSGLLGFVFSFWIQGSVLVWRPYFDVWWCLFLWYLTSNLSFQIVINLLWAIAVTLYYTPTYLCVCVCWQCLCTISVFSLWGMCLCVLCELSVSVLMWASWVHCINVTRSSLCRFGWVSIAQRNQLCAP